MIGTALVQVSACLELNSGPIAIFTKSAGLGVSVNAGWETRSESSLRVYEQINEAIKNRRRSADRKQRSISHGAGHATTRHRRLQNVLRGLYQGDPVVERHNTRRGHRSMMHKVSRKKAWVQRSSAQKQATHGAKKAMHTTWHVLWVQEERAYVTAGHDL